MPPTVTTTSNHVTTGCQVGYDPKHGYRIRHQDVEDFLINDPTQPPITNPAGINTPHD